MDKFNFLIKQARTYFETADHLAYVTYPVIGEPKMLFVVAENLYNSSTKLVDALLHYERLYKRIMEIPIEWEERIKLFARIAPRYKISLAAVEVIKDLFQIIRKYKDSPMVFSRGDKFVITSEKFSLKTLDINLLKQYIIEMRKAIMFVEALKK